MTRTARIYGTIPSKSNSYRIIQFKNKTTGKSHGSLAKTKALKEYEKNFYIQLPAVYRNKDIQSYFELHIDVYYPSQRSDLDGALKAALDCLQHAKAIRNDNKCVKIIAERYVDKKEPRIEFDLIEIDPPLPIGKEPQLPF